MSTGNSPAAARSAIARMLLPRPEIRIAIGSLPVLTMPDSLSWVARSLEHDDAAVAATDFADHDWLLTVLAQDLHRFVAMLGGDTYRHADAAVERAIHLLVGEVAGPLQPIEHG